MKNLKDTLTTICGILIAIGGALLTLDKTGVDMPDVIDTASAVAVTIATAVLAYLSGKNPDGTKKTPEQIEQTMKPKVDAEK